MKATPNAILRLIANKQDANQNGCIFGGWLLGQADIAASMLAIKFVKDRVVTISVDKFVFKSAVYPLDLLEFYGEVVKVGNTSISVLLKIVVVDRVYVADKPYYFTPHYPPNYVHKIEQQTNTIDNKPKWLDNPIVACEGVFTFVAIDTNGKKKSIKGEHK